MQRKATGGPTVCAGHRRQEDEAFPRWLQTPTPYGGTACTGAAVLWSVVLGQWVRPAYVPSPQLALLWPLPVPRGRGEDGVYIQAHDIGCSGTSTQGLERARLTRVSRAVLLSSPWLRLPQGSQLTGVG